VLENLTDITVRLHEDGSGFTLIFNFQENPYFSNQVLTKDYTWRSDPDPANPLTYEGPQIVNCKGCTVDWKEGMDVTKKKMKVKTIAGKKGKADSPVKVITKEAKVESFFNFFNPPTAKDGEEVEPEMNDLLHIDYEVGSAIKEKIIPRAVLYFTGEILDNGDSSDEEYDSEEEDEDEDEES